MRLFELTYKWQKDTMVIAVVVAVLVAVLQNQLDIVPFIHRLLLNTAQMIGMVFFKERDQLNSSPLIDVVGFYSSFVPDYLHAVCVWNTF